MNFKKNRIKTEVIKKKKKKRSTLRMEGTPVNQHLPAWPTVGLTWML